MVTKAESKKTSVLKKKKVDTKKNVKVIKETNVVAIEEKKEQQILWAEVIFRVFFDGWKKAFCLKGRSSRFEVWCFLLVNSVLASIVQLHSSYILSSSFLRDANMKGYSLSEIENSIAWASAGFWFSFLLPLIPIGAMLIRRMHDIGKLAWHGYLEQVFMGVVVMSMLLVSIDELSGTNFEYTTLALSVCFITIFYSVLYYALKFIITTLFYKGDDGDNEYGKTAFVGEIYEYMALKFSVFYFLFVFTLGMLYWGNWYF